MSFVARDVAPPLGVSGGAGSGSLTASPSHPPIEISRRRKQKPISFQKMALIQDEILKIEKHLNALEAVENLPPMPEGMQQQYFAADEVIDPVLAHMLTVELCQLAASGDSVGVKILLDGGADPNSRDYNGSTLLHIACTNGRVNVVNVLLEYGADANLLDREGINPLSVAEEGGYADIARVLTNLQDQGEGVVPDSFAGQPSSCGSSPASAHAPDFSSVPQPMVGSLIVVMVGLPGRGKTYVAQQIRRYFQWNGLSCSIFSHQLYRRRVERRFAERGPEEAASPNVVSPTGNADLEFRVSRELAHDLTKFVSDTGGVAVLDGTQTTQARRQSLFRAIKDTRLINTTRVVLVEVVTNDKETIHRNVLLSKEMYPNPTEDFVEKYYAVMAQHEAVYRTLNPVADSELSYIRIEDSRTFSLNMISGWMPSRLAFMLHNLSPSPKNLYLTRSGEYADMITGRIGGNSRLTERGRAYSKALFEFFSNEISADSSLTVMTSCAKRCTQTVHYFAEESVRVHRSPTAPAEEPRHPAEVGNDSVAGAAPAGEEEGLDCRVSYFPTLDDINHGDCEGQLMSDVMSTMPNTLQSMKADPYYTAWPNGECIHQVYNSRLEPHIHDIQASSSPVLVVSHLNLLQGLYSFFVTDGDKTVDPQNAFLIEVPFECVIKIKMVGVNRVAEYIDLSSRVDEILSMVPNTG